MAGAAKKIQQRVGLWRWVWRISAASFAGLVVLLALAIGLFRVAVPLFPDYQLRIQNAVTQTIGYPMQAGSIDARWRLRGPELLFRQVTVFSEDRSQKLIEADRLRIVIDVVSLLKHRKVRPAIVVVSGVQLEIQRTLNGQLYVQGMQIVAPGANATSTGPTPAWGLPDGHFSLQNIEVEYVDARQAGRMVEIRDIDVDVQISGSEISISGDVQLPGELGRRMDITVDATGSISSPDNVEWRAFCKGAGIDLAELARWWPQEPLFFVAGNAGVSVWTGGVGKRLQDASVQFDLDNLIVTADRMQQPLEFAELGGRLIWESRPEQWRLKGQSLRVRYADREWPPGNFELAGHNQTQTQDLLTRYSVQADYLNLDDLGPVLDLLGEKAWLQEWRRRAPGGELRQLSGFINLGDATVSDFGVTADAGNLSLLPADGVPGFSGIDGHVFGGRLAGGIDIRSTDATFHAPGVLREVIDIDALNMKIRWEQEDNGGLVVRVDNIRVATADLTARGTVVFRPDESEVGMHSEMELSVDTVRLAGASKYFPVNRMSPQLLGWLDAAFVDGTGSNGSFRVRGPLRKFPFRDPDDGEFTAKLDVENMTLHYARDWPDATSVSADIRFERDSLQATIADATLMNVNMRDGRVDIPDLKLPLVTLDGAVQTDLAPLREFLDTTPLVTNWGEEWKNFAMRGAATAEVHVDLATRDAQNTRYAIELTTSDARIQYRDWPQVLSGLNGGVKFTEAGIFGQKLTGLLLGERVALDIQPAPGAKKAGPTDIVLRGRMRSQSLGQHLQKSLATVSAGDTQWLARTRIASPDAGATPFTVQLQSPLEGMQINLPSPLHKAAADVRFLDATISVPAEGEVEVVVEYGGDTNIHALFAGTDRRWRVARGELRFGGGAAVLPETATVRAVGKIEHLDVSEILEFTKKYDSDEPWLELKEADISVAELDGFGQNFQACDVTAIHADAAWVIAVQGDRVSGNITVPDVISLEQPIDASFSTLQWTSDEEPTPLEPRDMPSIRVSSDNFVYDQYQLGSLQLQVEARDEILALREFKTRGDGFETRATGSWSFTGENESTYVVAELVSEDVRATLRSLQFAEFIESDSATARLELTWPNGWTPDYLQTVVGSLQLSVGQGTLRSVDPGAGRVFGLLSIGALPRRLGLDFRDVFGSGFGFDSITGDFELRDGSAYTENLALLGPAANVGVIGRTGLVARDYEQTAIVYANFGASLPLAGTLAGGPAVGAALLIFSELFRGPLRQMGQVSYEITGDWDDPQIIKTGSVRPAEPENTDADVVPALPPAENDG